MDYFNDDERSKQKLFADRRDGLLKPVVIFLSKIGILPNYITLASVVFLIFATFFDRSNYMLVALFLFLYVALDGLDGPLARFSGRSSEGGAVVDMFADQLGVVLVSAAACYHLGINGAFATVFSSLYISTIVFMVYLNVINVKYMTVLRVKYVLYVLYIGELALKTGLFDWFFLIFSVYYFFVSIVLLFSIYSNFSGEGDD